MPATVRVSTDGIFYTLQGEGPLAGIPSVFVRLDTCNLRCKWGDTLCDAHYTSWNPGDRRTDLVEFVNEVGGFFRRYPAKHLVITGGEPMLQQDAVKALCMMATVHGYHTTIETNGTVFVSCAADLICLSPKLKSSTPTGTKYEELHEKNRWCPEVRAAIRQFMQHYNYYFKFVINEEADIKEALMMLYEVGQRLPDPQHVVFMPQGIHTDDLNDRAKWIAEWCKQLGVRYTPRLQIQLWGNKPGT